MRPDLTSHRHPDLLPRALCTHGEEERVFFCLNLLELRREFSQRFEEVRACGHHALCAMIVLLDESGLV